MVGCRTAAVCSHSAGTALVSVSTALASFGRQQLLRRCVHESLRLHRRLASPLAAEVFGALGEAELADALDVDVGEAQQLPDLWDFLSDGVSGPKDAGAKMAPVMFRKRVARAGELGGSGEPFRQLYLSVSSGAVPAGVEALIVAILFAAAATASTGGSAGAQGSTRKSLRKSLGLSGAGSAGAAPAASCAEDDFGWPVEAFAALLAGVATLLQQLPEAVTIGVMELGGHCLAGICSEGADGKDASLAEGGRLLVLLGAVLDLLGLPRDVLASFVPCGLLDLWDFGAD